MKKWLTRFLTLCITSAFITGALGTVGVHAEDAKLRSEAERLLKEHLATFNNYAFAKSEGVSMGDEKIYMTALASVDLEHNPNLKGNAEYQPPKQDIYGNIVSRGKLVFKDDIGGGKTSYGTSGTIWHEVTHVIEGINGDDDAADANVTNYQERHIEYMEQCKIALDKLRLVEMAADKGQGTKELKERYEAFLAELAKAPKQPGPAEYPIDEARLLGWFGFKVMPKEILKHYATGAAGNALKELAKEYGITGGASADLGKYTWEGQWDSNWGHMVLTQSGNVVTGTYIHDSGRINAALSGGRLVGTWSEAPSYAPDRDAGDIEFVITYEP